MAENSDQLIRFLLPEAQSRGALIRGSHIIAEASRIHGLNGAAAELFGQALLASVLLLSVSKGGMRQVLQLDAQPGLAHVPLKRLMAETRPGAVRGSLTWQEEQIAMRDEGHTGLGSWMGQPIRLSTVRDLGFGQPYVSTIEYDSDFLADHVVHYLNQSVQVHADVILHGDLGIIVEAMPGSDDEHWFRAVEAMAAIPAATLETGSTDDLLGYFESLRCKEVGADDYAYRCGCSPEKMVAAIKAMPDETIAELIDENGNITVSCQYCNRFFEIQPGA